LPAVRTSVAACVALAVVSSSAAAQPAPDPEATPSGPTAAEPDDTDGQAVPPNATTPSATAPPAPTPAPAPAVAAPRPSFRWAPYGYLRAAAAFVRDDPSVAFVGRSDGFELQNARLGVRGALADRARFDLSIDGAIDERDHLNDPNGTLRVGLRDAFVDVAAGGLDVRIGRFEIAFDPDDLDGDLHPNWMRRRPFVDRSLVSRGVRATEGWEADGLPPGRSIGVAVRRDAPDDRAGVGFEVAAQNGAHEFASDNDNDQVALSAALLASLPAGGAVVGGVRWNPRSEGDLPLRQDETDLAASLGARLAAGPVALGGGVVLVRTTFGTTGGPAANAFGVHAQAMIQIVPGANPVALGYRFAILDPSSLVLTDRVMEHSAGAVMAIPALRLRLQLGATLVVEQAARALANDRLEAALEVEL